jgi:hypothetical protein
VLFWVWESGNRTLPICATQQDAYRPLSLFASGRLGDFTCSCVAILTLTPWQTLIGLDHQVYNPKFFADWCLLDKGGYQVSVFFLLRFVMCAGIIITFEICDFFPEQVFVKCDPLACGFAAACFLTCYPQPLVCQSMWASSFLVGLDFLWF